MLKVGETRTFRLNSHSGDRRKFRVTIGEDARSSLAPGRITLGDCHAKEAESRVMENGETLTITGCRADHIGGVGLHVWNATSSGINTGEYLFRGVPGPAGTPGPGG